VFEFEMLGEIGEDEGDDGVFLLFGILDENSVMYLHEELAVIRTPYSQHSTVKYIRERSLGVIGYGFSEGGVVVSTAEEVAPSPSKS
jgi:hypothetical protein